MASLWLSSICASQRALPSASWLKASSRRVSSRVYVFPVQTAGTPREVDPQPVQDLSRVGSGGEVHHVGLPQSMQLYALVDRQQGGPSLAVVVQKAPIEPDGRPASRWRAQVGLDLTPIFGEGDLGGCCGPVHLGRWSWSFREPVTRRTPAALLREPPSVDQAGEPFLQRPP